MILADKLSLLRIVFRIYMIIDNYNSIIINYNLLLNSNFTVNYSMTKNT